MRLVRLTLRNFRCYEKDTSINFEGLTAIIGMNDSGKSSILDALDIFFENSKIDLDDACVWGNKSDVRIMCELEDLPSEIVIDTNYPTTLQEEYLLNKHGRLEIHKVYDATGGGSPKESVFALARHPTADSYADLLSLTNQQLKNRAQSLKVDLSDVDQRVNTAIRRAIWKHCKDLQISDSEIELKKEAGKAVWDQIKKRLPVFSLFKSDRPSTDEDSEAQDPMKAAVKEALRQ